jgi:hypothetical protein
MRRSAISIRSTPELIAVNTTPRPKSLAMMFMLGAFLTGGAVGFAAERAIAKPVVMLNDDKSVREELARELKLTSEQKVVVDSAWDWRRARNREIMAVVRPALDAVLFDAFDELPPDARVGSLAAVAPPAGMTSLVPIFMRVGSTVGLALAMACHLFRRPRKE